MRPDRDHQTRVIREYGELVRAGQRRVLIQLPTGGGKTHIGLRCAGMMTGRRGRVLWCAHRDELVNQPVKRILADGWPVTDLCVITAGRTSGPTGASLTIASIQTLLAMPSKALASLLATFDLFVLDEARHYAAAQWGTIARAAKPSAYMLGLDATPVRTDGKPLGDLFDHLLTGATVSELVAAGHLVPSVVLAPAAAQDELAEDPADAYARVVPGESAIVFCGSVTHARNVAADIRARGFTAEALDAKTREDVRTAALARYMSGETRVLCNVRILTEGTDLPRTSAILHACRPGSLADWIQKGGRGLRPSPETGKDRCTVIDLQGSVHAFGLLDDPHVWTLDGAGVRQADALPQIGQCPKCYAWGRSATSCRMCGYVLPMFAPPAPKVKAADLVEVRRADADDVRRARLDKFALEEVRAGRSAWRAAHRYRGTYSEAPPREWMIEAEQAAKRAVAAEQRKRVEASEPLWERMRS